MSGMNELDMQLREQVNDMTFGEIAEFVRVNGVASWLAALDDIQDLIVFYLSVQPFGEQDDEND